MKQIASNFSFGGYQKRYEHFAETLNCQMTFSIFLPPHTKEQKVPVLYWLSGLTCTDENFVQKAGAQRIASKLGIAIVAPDTSPRGEDIADDPSYDLGQGAGFYVNATKSPWQKHYQMYDYVVKELPTLIEGHFPVSDKRSISGHSMGGHGALVIGLKNSERYQSISAFSPIVNPINCPWGKKAFSSYLGENEVSWKQYDAVELLKNSSSQLQIPIKIDQGLADDFLQEQLHINTIIEVLNEKGSKADIKMHPDYDHSYFFIASFIEDHIEFHSRYLNE